MLRIALSGCGGRSEIAPGFDLPELESELVCACDVDRKNAERFAADFSARKGRGLRLYGDYREMLEKETPDAVLILTPDHLHFEQAEHALRHHVSVFLDKPMALRTEHCDRMIRTAREEGRKLMVGHNMRYMRFTRKIRELVRDGAVGEVQAVWCRHFVDYGGYAYFTRWMCEEDKVNSLLLQKGAHDIDVIHWFAGSETTRAVGMGKLGVFDRCHRRRPGEPRPSEDSPVWPPLEKRNLNPVIDVNDHNMVLLQLANGVQAALLECFYTPDACRNYVVLGTAGRIENYGDTHENARVVLWNKRHPDRLDFNLEGDESFDVRPGPGSHGGADVLIARDFIRYLRDEKEPDVPVSAARAAVAAGCAGADSMRLGGVPVDVEPMRVEEGGRCPA